MSDRKAFNFYLSFYEVFNEIEKDKDKLSFITALLDRQFTGVEPELKGEARFAYISQKQVIDQQIRGWEDKSGKKLQSTDNATHQTLPKGGAEGGQNTPALQEKGQVQEKEKGEGEEKGGDEHQTPTPDSESSSSINNQSPVKEKSCAKKESEPDHPLVAWLKKECPDVMKMKQPLTNTEAAAILTDYPDRKFIKELFTSMDNYAPLKKNNKSANRTFRKWAARENKSNTNQDQPVTALAPRTTGDYSKHGNWD